MAELYVACLKISPTSDAAYKLKNWKEGLRVKLTITDHTDNIAFEARRHFTDELMSFYASLFITGLGRRLQFSCCRDYCNAIVGDTFSRTNHPRRERAPHKAVEEVRGR